MELKDICQYVSDRVATTSLSTSNYISTENMLPNKGGVVIANGLPVGNAVAFAKDDVLVSNIRPYFKKIWQANKNGGCSADVLCFRKNENVDNKYFYYLLSQQSFFDYMMLGSKGCKMPRGDKKQIMNWSFNLPSLEEQKRIADILSSLDSKIELNRRINDNLEQQAQALFAEIFESDYTFAQLGAVIETCSGGTPSRNNLDYYIDGTICWVKSKELNRSFLFDTEEKIAQVGIDKSSAKLLPKNSVLIAMYGATVGEYCIIDKPMTCNQAICALLPSSNYPASYLYMFVKQKRNELINLAVGSAQQNISQVLIKGLSVSANLKLIAKFDKMVMPIFNMIRKNAKESIILEAERNTLLPRLMSGELKINDLNC